MADPENAKLARQCPKCHHCFRDPSTLRRHLGRKRPCAPVVEPEDAPQGGAADATKCKYCGRSYSSEWNLRRHMRSCPIAARGERGMNELYEYVLEKTRRAEEADLEIQALRAELEDVRGQLDNRPAVTVTDSQVLVDAGVHVAGDVTINVFGREETSHVSGTDIRRILTECSGALGANPQPKVINKAAIQALMEAAFLIYSDPDYPGNVTCFVPNQRGDNALVHTSREDGTTGWEIRPVQLVLPPMARLSLDLLFDKQPFEDADQCEKALQVLREREEQLITTGGGLKPVLIRNKQILSQLLSQLPDPNTKGSKLKLESPPETDD